ARATSPTGRPSPTVKCLRPTPSPRGCSRGAWSARPTWRGQRTSREVEEAILEQPPVRKAAAEVGAGAVSQMRVEQDEPVVEISDAVHFFPAAEVELRAAAEGQLHQAPIVRPAALSAQAAAEERNACLDRRVRRQEQDAGTGLTAGMVGN